MGARQGLLFIGLLLAALSLAAGGYFYFVAMPRHQEFAASPQQIDSIGPVDAWQYWTIVRRGIPLTLTLEAADVLERTRKARIGLRGRWGSPRSGWLSPAGACWPRTKTPLESEPTQGPRATVGTSRNLHV